MRFGSWETQKESDVQRHNEKIRTNVSVIFVQFLEEKYQVCFILDLVCKPIDNYGSHLIRNLNWNHETDLGTAVLGKNGCATKILVPEPFLEYAGHLSRLTLESTKHSVPLTVAFLMIIGQNVP